MDKSSEAAMRVAREIWRHNVQALSRAGTDTPNLIEVPEIAQIIDRGMGDNNLIDALETQITTSETRNAELVAALITIRGWREIGHAVTLGERLQAVEDIAHQALVKHEREKTK